MALDPNMLLALGLPPQLAAGQGMGMQLAGMERGPPTGGYTPALRPSVPISEAPPGSIPSPGLGEQTTAPPPTPPPPVQPGATYPSMAATSAIPYLNPAQVAGSVGGNIGANPMGMAPYMPGGQMAGGTPWVGGGEFSTPPTFPPSPITGPAGGAMAQGPGGGGGLQKSLQDAMRGVQALAPPQVQTVRTPPPPALRPIQGGEFMNLMSSLGIGPQQFMELQRMRLR